MFCVKHKILATLQQCNNCKGSCWKFISSCVQLIRQRICRGDVILRVRCVSFWVVIISNGEEASSGVISTTLDQETGLIHFIHTFFILGLFSVVGMPEW